MEKFIFINHHTEKEGEILTIIPVNKINELVFIGIALVIRTEKKTYKLYQPREAGGDYGKDGRIELQNIFYQFLKGTETTLPLDCESCHIID